MASGSGSASGPVTAAASGFSVAELLTKITDILEWDKTDGPTAIKVYQAITEAGQTAATWKGSDWWWLQDGTGTFSMVVSTFKYVLRTINSSDMSDLLRVTRVYFDDDWALTPITWRRYRELQAVSMNDTTSRPTMYTVNGSAPIIYLLPNPSTTETINVDYIRFHGKISSGTDGSLIVPEEYQTGVYVDAPLWILRREIGDISSLDENPQFISVMNRMGQSHAMAYDDDPDTKYNPPIGSGPGNLPNDTHYTVFPDGGVAISNQPTL